MGFGTFKDNGRSSGLKLTESLQHKKINSKRHAKNCVYFVYLSIYLKNMIYLSIHINSN